MRDASTVVKSSVVVWQDPPPSQKGLPSSRWEQVAAELRSRPGKWALVDVGNSGTAVHIKTGQLKAFRPAGTFEATTRSRRDGQFDVYARYVG